MPSFLFFTVSLTEEEVGWRWWGPHFQFHHTLEKLRINTERWGTEDKRGLRILPSSHPGSVALLVVLTQHAPSPELDPQHCINCVWSHLPVIPALRNSRNSRPEVKSSRSSSTTKRVGGKSGLHQTLSLQNNQPKSPKASAGPHVYKASILSFDLHPEPPDSEFQILFYFIYVLVLRVDVCVSGCVHVPWYARGG